MDILYPEASLIVERVGKELGQTCSENVSVFEPFVCSAPVNLDRYEIPGIKEFVACGGKIIFEVDLPNGGEEVITDLTPYFS